jgi:hypothetical protein
MIDAMCSMKSVPSAGVKRVGRAAQVQAADQALVAQQRHQRHALQARRRRGNGWCTAGAMPQGPGLGVARRSKPSACRFGEQQVREGGEIHAQLVHHGADVGVLVDQGQGDDIEFRNDGQAAEDGADQAGKIVGADDLEVERLVAAHDVVIALGLFKHVGHARAQGLIFGGQFA